MVIIPKYGKYLEIFNIYFKFNYQTLELSPLDHFYVARSVFQHIMLCHQHYYYHLLSKHNNHSRLFI